MKSVLITEAYRGLGFETARQLSERGWQVILSARRKEQGAEAVATDSTGNPPETAPQDLLRVDEQALTDSSGSPGNFKFRLRHHRRCR
ncbi:MAG: SDR family NAD(P)-dependent oxidoreductase [Limisphaerales bacterium]